MSTCPICHKPCVAAELHAYGKCEDCYNPSPLALSAFPKGVPFAQREPQNPAHTAGGGQRVIRTTRGLS